MKRMYERLKALEMNARLRTATDAAERAERHRLLERTVEDETAMTFYNALLTALSGTCAHLTIGACRACWRTRQHAEPVQTALSRYQDRMDVLRSQHTTKEVPS